MQTISFIPVSDRYVVDVHRRRNYKFVVTPKCNLLEGPDDDPEFWSDVLDDKFDCIIIVNSWGDVAFYNQMGGSVARTVAVIAA